MTSFACINVANGTMSTEISFVKKFFEYRIENYSPNDDDDDDLGILYVPYNAYVRNTKHSAAIQRDPA